MRFKDSQDLRHDGKLWIAVGTSHRSKNWKNTELDWSQLVREFSNTRRTGETTTEYRAKPKADRDLVKDVGAFVGGSLTAGQRLAANVRDRYVLTLDADHIEVSAASVYTRIQALGCAALVYSTHSHTPEAPRLRIVIPLDRPISPDEHDAISRKVADKIGMNWMDRTTFDINRLMYFPSTPQDGEYFFQYEDQPFLSADGVLSEYPDWRDSSFWPGVEMPLVAKKEMPDPREAGGVVGAFCSVFYPISTAIDRFLSEVYEPTEPGRYTFLAGTSAKGLIVDDLYCYSFHSTDAANNGHSHSAFNLVMIHKFGDDFKAACEWAANIPEVGLYMLQRKFEDAGAEFKDMEWSEQLERDKKGGIKPSRENYLLILENDPAFKTIRYNTFAMRLEFEKLPWRNSEKTGSWEDDDDRGLRVYMEKHYTDPVMKLNLEDSFGCFRSNRTYHPVREWIESLPPWDEKREMQNFFIEFLQADNDKCTRYVTEKFFIAMVARVFDPGCKFDNVLAFDGAQGIGKSTIAKALGGRWYDDSFNLTMAMTKDGMSLLNGIWLMEIGELAGLRKAEQESIKAFITKQSDRYRPSFGHHEIDRPRQTVFMASSNNAEFLTDPTGNRRWWTIHCSGAACDPRLHDQAYMKIRVEKVFAEAYARYQSGEPIHISDPQIQKAMEEKQANHTVQDDRIEGLKAWLDETTELGGAPCQQVTRMEIWTGYLCEPIGKYKPDRDGRIISNLMKQIEDWEPYKSGSAKGFRRKSILD